MREIALSDPVGKRFVPDVHNGTGVLTVAGSSGRLDTDRAQVLCSAGAIVETIQWFGGPGQHAQPWEIPVELFRQRVAAVAAECDRLVLVGTSFGAEAVLLTGSLDPLVDAVVAFAPTDVVWAGFRPDGTQTSHWTVGRSPVPYLPLVDWRPTSEPPAFRELYRLSREHATDAAAAEIAVERIPDVLLVAGPCASADLTGASVGT
ncbi:hypothetical protein SAMN04489812_5285 [Microlunatus soli]|uniref:BAAT / Acyl-CoA thioester hydrolase C terminal n=1 Tax=Microlunatus soli TaxID=630515 RepID=A0A1H1ZKP7_9ACTN|nr:hypothetical protein SAMN04489812_5285 [Microlunatus soli]